MGGKSNLTETLEKLIEKERIEGIIVRDKRICKRANDLGQPVQIDETSILDERTIDILTDRGYLITIKMKK